MSKTLIIDGQNFMHRARSGFQLGDFNVVFNFFRSLKPLVEKFKPNRVIFTREGHPKHRYEMLSEYKANRIIDQTTEEGQDKHKSLLDFFRQADIIVKLLSDNFPISVMKHADFEADDLIYNVIKNSSSSTEFIVASSDSDFTQLLQQFTNVKLYNPITKSFVQAPEYDYVVWKALRGDGSDNIPGIPGVGDKTAETVLSDKVALEKLVRENAEIFNRNCDLIRFPIWTPEETDQVTSTSPTKDWDAVKKFFEQCEFKSMLKDSYWEKFQATFDTLWE